MQTLKGTIHKQTRSGLPLLCLSVLSFLTAPGCKLGLLDGMGVATASSDQGKAASEIKDDDIADKHPVYDEDITVDEVFGSCTVTLNKSGSVTKLDIVPFGKDEKSLDGVIFPTKEPAIAAAQDQIAGNQEAGRDLQASMETINGAVKVINDGMYAALEMRLQDGISQTRPGKRQFLKDLAQALSDASASESGAVQKALKQGLSHVVAGLLAGGNDPASMGLNLDQDTLDAARQQIDKFDEVPLFSKPAGFYTWNDTLEEVFRQDRFFHNSLSNDDRWTTEFPRYAAIAAVLNENQDLLDAYQTFLTAAAGLDTKFASHPVTDILPYVPSRASLANLDGIQSQFREENPPLSPCDGPYVAFFPASLAKDTEYVSSTYCNQSLPAGTTIFDVIVSAIRNGDLDLTPDQDSGWYDYQLYALETLLVPEKGIEKDHLFLTAKYKKKLIESFKTMITQIRETHYKGLDLGGVGTAAPMPKYEVYPKLPIEPFPTYYLRTARAYRFLATMLQALLGDQVLADTKALGPDGSDSDVSVQSKLKDVTRLMYGFYVVAARSLGMDPQAYLLDGEDEEYPLADCEQAARDWIASWTQDENVLTDGRVVVPVSYDATTDEFVYWAVVGVKIVESRASFYEGFEPKVIQAVTTDDRDCEFEGFTDRAYYLLMEPTVEFRRPAAADPLTRDELRSICDAHDSLDDIKKALEDAQ